MELTFKYGQEVVDTITGFTGKVTGFCHYYYKEQDQYRVEGIDNTGRPIEDWITVYRLKPLVE